MRYIVKCPNNNEYTIRELSEKYNLGYATILSRIKRGVTDFSEIVSKTSGKTKYKMEKENGEMVTIKELAREKSLTYHTLRKRYLEGLRGEDLIRKVPSKTIITM